MSKEDIIRAAKQDSILKAPPVMSFSATNPAYTYTSLCPDRSLREPPKRKIQHPEGIRPVAPGKICLICRKHWPIDCGRKNCDCDGKGHLFSTGIYYQRKVKGGS